MRILAPNHLTYWIDSILISKEHYIAGIEVDPIHVSPPHVSLVVNLEIVCQAIQKLGGLQDACEEVHCGHIRVVREGVGFKNCAICDRELRNNLLETTHEHVVLLNLWWILYYVNQESHFASEQLQGVQGSSHIIAHGGCGLGGYSVNCLGNMIYDNALAITRGKFIVHSQKTTFTLLELVNEKREYILLSRHFQG